jgi:choline dehydrogenase-like flavoprotein
VRCLGGGAAGSFASLLLARAGHEVAVLERDRSEPRRAVGEVASAAEVHASLVGWRPDRQYVLTMPALTEAEYKATMGTPMAVVQPDDDLRPTPLAGYVDAIPASDLRGHDFTGRHVEKVYRDPSGRFFHVLVAATTPTSSW